MKWVSDWRWDSEWDWSGKWSRSRDCGSDKSTRRGVMDNGWLDEEREGMEVEEEGCGTIVCSWGELLSEGGAER